MHGLIDGWMDGLDDSDG
jgi:hypothetical protein